LSGGPGGDSLQNDHHHQPRACVPTEETSEEISRLRETARVQGVRHARACGRLLLYGFPDINPEATRGIPEPVGGRRESTASGYGSARSVVRNACQGCLG
jgi:hypothetical protein